MTIIAIDGPGASGKSTLARLLGAKLGLQVIESGKYYRYITYILESLVPKVSEPAEILQAVERLGVIQWDDIHCPRISQALREDAISSATPRFSALPQIRELVNSELRRLAASQGGVIEGRDIGTVVFPDTPWKLFLEVPLQLRELRRKSEGSAEELSKRDQADSQRKTAPLRAAEDAIILRISSENAETVCAQAIDMLRARGYTIP